MHHDTNATRRAFLRGSASAVAVLPVVAAPAALAASDADAAVNALWERWLALMAESRTADAAYRAAVRTLPWWAAPGPIYLQHDGTFEGRISHAPAIQDVEPPQSSSAVRLIREDRVELDKRFHTIAGVTRPPTGRLLERYQSAVQEFEARRRAQEAEFENAGLPALEAWSERVSDEGETIREEIEALPPSLNRAAAILLYAAATSAGARDTPRTTGPLRAANCGLRALQPFLTAGAVAESVAEFLDNPERPIHLSPFWGAVFDPDDLHRRVLGSTA